MQESNSAHHQLVMALRAVLEGAGAHTQELPDSLFDVSLLERVEQMRKEWVQLRGIAHHYRTSINNFEGRAVNPLNIHQEMEAWCYGEWSDEHLCRNCFDNIDREL